MIISLANKNMIRYVLLTMVRFGLFSFYWTHVFKKDLNEHFRQERKIKRYRRFTRGNRIKSIFGFGWS